MDFTQLYNKLITEFQLGGLNDADKESMLYEIMQTVQKQFLLDVFNELGEEKFAALEQSANMGEQFYSTTLKHLVPNYEEFFQNALAKVTENFKKEA